MALSIREKAFLVEHYFRSYGIGHSGGPSVKRVFELFEEEFHRTPPTKRTLLLLVNKFRQTGSVLCQRKNRCGRKRTSTDNEHAGLVLDKILRSPKKSQRRIAKELGMKRTSVQTLVHELGAFSYRMQVCHNLREPDKFQRRMFCARTLANVYEDENFLSNIWFSDECHITLEGYVNKQTTRFLGFERPTEVVERPLHSQKVTVWSAISGHGIIGPYFLEDVTGRRVNVNQETYRELVVSPFVQALRRFCRARNLRFRKQWFQQDGATAHTAGDTLKLVRQHFQNRIISRGTDYPYPSNSPDLTPPDAYLWGILKERVYRDPVPRDIAQLKTNIRRVLHSISQDTIAAMFVNLQCRYEKCLEVNGSYLEHVL